MSGKSWFPDWNEYGKDLYPAVDSRSPRISCPQGAYLIPAALLFSVERDRSPFLYHRAQGVIKNIFDKGHQRSTQAPFSVGFTRNRRRGINEQVQSFCLSAFTNLLVKPKMKGSAAELVVKH